MAVFLFPVDLIVALEFESPGGWRVPIHGYTAILGRVGTNHIHPLVNGPLLKQVTHNADSTAMGSAMHPLPRSNAKQVMADEWIHLVAQIGVAFPTRRTEIEISHFGDLISDPREVLVDLPIIHEICVPDITLAQHVIVANLYACSFLGGIARIKPDFTSLYCADVARVVCHIKHVVVFSNANSCQETSRW